MKKFLVILTVFFALTSFTSCTEVENGFKGVVYEPYNGGLDPKQVYPEGVDMGFSWLYNDMITYDCRQHTTDITTKLLDKNGLDVPITASVFHRVIPTNIGYLHLEKGETYEETYIRPVFEGVLKDVIGKYTAQELIVSKRQQAQVEMKQLLTEAFAKNHLQCDDVIIRDLDLPNSISEAIEAKQVQEERNLKSEKFKVEKDNLAAAQIAEAEGNYKSALFDTKTKALLSTPAILKLKQLNVLQTYADKGISPFGSNNVFDKESVSLFITNQK
tara:strand:+ start:60365 stop:61183 length:819 start_codon:yes stop_codon:yes gene_type:complete